LAACFRRLLPEARAVRILPAGDANRITWQRVRKLHEHGTQEPDSGGFDVNQQLVARIKRSSKYYGQTKPGEWFDVRIVHDMGYGLRGNNNNYRFGDVVFGVRLEDGTIVVLK
jgi:hypothetical protein